MWDQSHATQTCSNEGNRRANREQLLCWNSLITKTAEKEEQEQRCFYVVCSCHEEMGLSEFEKHCRILSVCVVFVVFSSYELDFCCFCKVLIFKNIVYSHVI